MKALRSRIVPLLALAVLLAGAVTGEAATKPLGTTKSANTSPYYITKPTAVGGATGGTKTKSDIDVISKNGGAGGIDPKKDIDVIGGINVRSLTATRTKDKITLTGVISNSSSEKLYGVRFTFSKLNGSSPTVIKSSTLRFVAAKEQTTVMAELPASFDAIRFRLEATGNGKTAKKEFQLAAGKKPVIVLRFSTNGWILVADQKEDGNPNKLIGEEARKTRDTLKGIGFETETRMTKNTGVFSNSYRTMVYARALKFIFKKFDTRAEANAFELELRKLTRNLQPGTNGAPNTFLSIFESEE